MKRRRPMLTGLPTQAELEARIGKERYRKVYKANHSLRSLSREGLCERLRDLGWYESEIELFLKLAYRAVSVQ